MVKKAILRGVLNQVEETDLVYFIYFLRRTVVAPHLCGTDIPNISIISYEEFGILNQIWHSVLPRSNLKKKLYLFAAIDGARKYPYLAPLEKITTTNIRICSK